MSAVSDGHPLMSELSGRRCHSSPSWARLLLKYFKPHEDGLGLGGWRGGRGGEVPVSAGPFDGLSSAAGCREEFVVTVAACGKGWCTA